MKTKPDVGHPIHPLIASRWSPRSFSNKELSDQTVCSLFEAARWTPSAHNIQPWAFLYGVSGTADHDMIATCLKDTNAIWARHAPLLVLVLEHADASQQAVHRHSQYDVGQSAAYLTFQASALGLYVHQIAGFNVDHARSLPGVASNETPMTVLAVGYLGDSNTLPQHLLQREQVPQSRKPLSEIVRRASSSYACSENFDNL